MNIINVNVIANGVDEKEVKQHNIKNNLCLTPRVFEKIKPTL